MVCKERAQVLTLNLNWLDAFEEVAQQLIRNCSTMDERRVETSLILQQTNI